jgi:hypothetical protein
LRKVGQAPSLVLPVVASGKHKDVEGKESDILPLRRDDASIMRHDDYGLLSKNKKHLLAKNKPVQPLGPFIICINRTVPPHPNLVGFGLVWFGLVDFSLDASPSFKAIFLP